MGEIPPPSPWILSEYWGITFGNRPKLDSVAPVDNRAPNDQNGAPKQCSGVGGGSVAVAVGFSDM